MDQEENLDIGIFDLPVSAFRIDIQNQPRVLIEL